MSGRRAERAKQDRLPADGLPEPRNRHRERIGPDHHESLFRVVPPRNRPVGEGSRILARFTPSVRSVAHPYCRPESGGAPPQFLHSRITRPPTFHRDINSPHAWHAQRKKVLEGKSGRGRGGKE